MNGETMTNDPTNHEIHEAEHVEPTTGELVPVRSSAWVEKLHPNQTTDGYVPAMPALIRAAELIYQTPFVPRGLRTPGGTLGAMMYGRELGMPPLTAVQALHEINGKVGMSAEMMRARITAAGHQFDIVEATAQRCRIRCRRREDRQDPEGWRVVEYTYAEASLAGDDRNKEGKQQGTNYQKRPVDMLVARCTTRAARWHFPDEIHGLSTVEELDDLARAEEREFDGPTPQQTAPVARQASPRAERVMPRATRQPSKPAAAPEGERPPEGGEAASGPQKAAGGDVVEAEFSEVQEAAAPASVPAAEKSRPVAPEGPLVAASQRAAIMGHFSRLGLADDRDERLEAISTLVGRRVASANELTRSEASRLLDVLGKYRDREGLYRDLGNMVSPDAAAAAEEGTPDV